MSEKKSAMERLPQERVQQYERDLERSRGDSRYASDEEMLVSAAMGLVEEVGEILAAASSRRTNTVDIQYLHRIGEDLQQAQDEAKEKFKAAMLLELGDALWYVTTIANRSGMPLLDVEETTPALETLWHAEQHELGFQARFHNMRVAQAIYEAAADLSVVAAMLCGMIRKHAFNQKADAPKPLDVPAVQSWLSLICAQLLVIASCLRVSMDDVKAANVRKLDARWPKGFSTDDPRSRGEGSR